MTASPRVNPVVLMASRKKYIAIIGKIMMIGKINTFFLNNKPSCGTKTLNHYGYCSATNLIFNIVFFRRLFRGCARCPYGMLCERLFPRTPCTKPGVGGRPHEHSVQSRRLGESSLMFRFCSQIKVMQRVIKMAECEFQKSPKTTINH